MSRGARRPEWDGDELRGRLRQYDRAPFLDLLSHWLENAPSADAIEKLATRSPDKYISALTQLARIAGFTEKSEATVDINVHISQMSDSQLEDYIRANMGVIEGTLAPNGEAVGQSVQLPAPLPSAALTDSTLGALSENGTDAEHQVEIVPASIDLMEEHSTEAIIRHIFKRADADRDPST
jgi:hypothetical protein